MDNTDHTGVSINPNGIPHPVTLTCSNCKKQITTKIKNEPGSGMIKKNNFSPIVSAQCNFNLLNQNAIHNLFPTCNQHGISVLAYGVLARGILGGAYGKNLPIPDDSRAKISDSIESDLTPEILEIITKLKYQSKKIGISLPILSISWALSYSTLASAIIGIKNIKHLEGVVAAANKKIDTSIFTDLVKISSYSWNGKNLSMNA